MKRPRPALLVFLFIGVPLYVTAAALHLPLLLVTRIEHTYQEPPGSPGSLISARYTATWYVRFFTGLRIWVIAALVLFFVWQESTFCQVIWLAVIGVFCLVSWVSFVLLSIEYSSCNGYGQAQNQCSDLHYCCLKEHLENPINYCHNTSPCGGDSGPIIADDLAPRPEFLLLFWGAAAFTAADTIIIMAIIAWKLFQPQFQSSMQRVEDTLNFSEVIENRIQSYYASREKKRSDPELAIRQYQPLLVDLLNGSTKRRRPQSRQRE